MTVAAFLLLTFLCALMSISGIVFTPKISDNGITPLTIETVEETSDDATRIVAVHLTAQVLDMPTARVSRPTARRTS